MVRAAALGLAAALLCAGCSDFAFSEEKEAVRYTLLDPDSAQFRGLARCPVTKVMIYGSVNAKNRLGAYTGFQPFFATGSRAATFRDYDYESMREECHGPTAREVPDQVDDEPIDVPPL